MSLSEVAGQDKAKAVALAWLESGRIPHAILVCGAVGVGKRRFALELAKAILCSKSNSSSCDSCQGCRKIDSFLHPDLHAVMPLPPRRGKREASPEVLREATVEHVLSGSAVPPGNANIAVEHLRQLQRELAYAPTEAPRKIGLIFAAERMHPAGANSLLKILEEPPARVTLVLVSAAPESLLPTVLSRCQRLVLGPLNAEALRQELKGRGVSGERLELAVRMGAGSLQRAQEVAAGEFDEIRRRVEEFLEAGAAKQDEVYWKILDELGNDRGQLECFLQVCSVYLRDLFLLAYGRSESVVQIDRREYLDNLLERVDAARAALEIDRVVETLGHNASTQLVLTDLWRILRRGGRAAAFPPDASLVMEGH